MDVSNIDLPSIDKLLELEKRSRVDGSGIEFNSLIGLWKFNSVWKQGSDTEDTISSTLLQILSASLELKKNTNNIDDENFIIAIMWLVLLGAVVEPLFVDSQRLAIVDWGSCE